MAAVLGQGEALDCFNMKAQDAVAINEQLKNIEALQQLETLQNISDSIQKAEMYKKVYGLCCDTPQTQIISYSSSFQKPPYLFFKKYIKNLPFFTTKYQ